MRQHGEIPDELPGYRAVWDPETGAAEDAPNYWRGSPPPETLASEIGRMLPQCKSWSEKALMFGDEDGNTARIWLGEELEFRFDLRRPDLDLLRAVVGLAASHSLLWVSDRIGGPLPPDLDKVLLDIQASDAYHFCRDPQAYLKSLPKEARLGEQGASPNGGPAVRLGNSGASGGPPSVS